MLRYRSRSSNSPQPVSPPASPRKTRLNVAGVANIFIKMRRLEEASKTDSAGLESGEPRSHPGLVEAACQRRVPVELVDNYVCVGGVNVATLLRATRNSLFDIADTMGATALVEEQWKCSISSPRNKSNSTYKVQVRYTAQATRSSQPDPHRPIALEQAKSIPGLMTIISRNDL